MIIAEIGWNFLGDIQLAKKMVDEAIKAGCKFVKFQLWHPDNLKKGSWDNDGRREIYQKAYLDYEKYFDLYNYCIQKGIKCFASVFDSDGYKILKKISNKLIKIPSLEAYDINLIKKSLQDFEFVIVSTGALKKDELDKLLIFKNEENFLPLHCVSSYPLEINKSNFEKFFYLKKNFKEVGYSGHCKGIHDAIFAISHGATVVEKHFTINNNLPGRDNKFALLPNELKIICNYFEVSKDFSIMHGLELQDCELDAFSNYRGRFRKKK